MPSDRASPRARKTARWVVSSLLRARRRLGRCSSCTLSTEMLRTMRRPGSLLDSCRWQVHAIVEHAQHVYEQWFRFCEFQKFWPEFFWKFWPV